MKNKKKKVDVLKLLPISLKVCIEKIMVLNYYYNIDLISIYAADFIDSDFNLFIDYVDKLCEDMKGGE